jgi:plastocyanin
MNSIIRTISAAILLVFAASACLGKSSPSIQAAPAVTIHMTVAKQYDPKNVTISVGDTVEWVNDDPANMHNITTNKDATDIPKAIQMPKGAKPFDSGLIVQGKKWSYRFMVPGTYRYVCVPHQPEMVGTIIVRPRL